MRCVSCCTADSYKLSELVIFFKNKEYKEYAVKQYRKVLHLANPLKGQDIFIFSYGCVVTWGLKRHDELALVKQLEPFAINALQTIESDSFVYRNGEKTEMLTHERFNVDMIFLDSYSAPLKLAISYGLAKSIQLEAYETEVQKLIDKNMPCFNDLAKKGKISLLRLDISKRLGEIFAARSKINLNSEYLEAPEYFWEYPSLEVYYMMSEKFLDIPRRVTALNQKLDVLHELFDMLTTQLQSRHSNFLEVVIILLIFFEIVFSILNKFVI